jgi:uridine kinase
MHSTTEAAAIQGALQALDRSPPRCGTTKVVAVDGPSGAGKSGFASRLAELVPSSHVLHMDDLYPGWDGLEQAVADLYDRVLAPLTRGEQAAYRRWDWEGDRPAGWQRLPSTNVLIVEGVGSGAAPGTQLESVLIWLEANPDVRLRRGIERDGASYRPHWQRWAQHEQALFARDRTRGRADLILDTSILPMA